MRCDLMVNGAAELFRCIASEAGIRPGVHHQGEIPERPASVQSPEVDRDRDPDGPLPLYGHLRALQADDALRHHRREKRSRRHLIPVSGVQQILRAHDSGRQCPEALGIRRSVQAEGAFLPAAGRGRRGIFQETVLQFFGRRRFLKIRQNSLPWDPRAVSKLQIARRETGEKNAPPVPVGQRMKEFAGDAVLIVQDAQAVPLQFPAAHEGERIGVVPAHAHRFRTLFEIIPEESLPERHEEIREMSPEVAHRLLQDLRIDRFGQGRRDAEGVAPVPARDRREDQRRRIQAIPFPVHILRSSCFPEGSTGNPFGIPQRIRFFPPPGLPVPFRYPQADPGRRLL